MVKKLNTILAGIVIAAAAMILAIMPSCSSDVEKSVYSPEKEIDTKISDKMIQPQTDSQNNSIGNSEDNSIGNSEVANSYMLSMVGTISSVSGDSAIIDTDSGEVEVNLSELKDGDGYPEYVSSGTEMVVSYFPEDNDPEGRIIIRQVMLKSQYDEIARRNGR
ncbi:hypothetical protein [Slackia isoflavoniconvertens]|uniref:hypothetical protein n=1 Tax=Slackia isoflavoniconvertens TaxID=572010 RepID=UPI003AF0D705